jgi:hypothetical protein
MQGGPARVLGQNGYSLAAGQTGAERAVWAPYFFFFRDSLTR